MILKTIPVGMHPTNCYLLGDPRTHDSIIVDPGNDAERILKVIEQEQLHPQAIVLTHGHYDHVLAVPELLDRLHVKLMLHADDEIWLTSERIRYFTALKEPYRTPKVDTYLTDGMTFYVGNLECKIMSTPGHTKGSCIIICKDVLLVGDTLFKNSCGRCDLPDGDADAMVVSLRKIAALPGNYQIYCGHGESTTLDDERQYNPYVKIAVRT